MSGKDELVRQYESKIEILSTKISEFEVKNIAFEAVHKKKFLINIHTIQATFDSNTSLIREQQANMDSLKSKLSEYEVDFQRFLVDC